MNQQTNNQTNQSAAVPDPSETPANRERSARRPARFIVIAVVILLTIAAVAIGIPWGYYRSQHVVLGEATIKGLVTKIGARIEGRIKSIEVEAGQLVSKRQVLLRLEDSHLVAALEGAQSQLESATKELENEKLGIKQTGRSLSLELQRVNGVRKQASGGLQATKGTLVGLQKHFDRVTTLLESGLAAASEMDQTTGDRDRAQGLLDAATGFLESSEFNYQKATNELDGLSVRRARLSILESQIAIARAGVAAVESDMDASVIRAPEDGRVMERIVEVGGAARVGEPMITLWIGRPWVEAWVDERDLRKFQIGSPADISLDASAKGKLSGRVESIGLVTDKELQPAPLPASRHGWIRQYAMVPVRIALDGDNSAVQLGLSAVVGIQKESASSDTNAPALLGRVSP